MQSEYSEYWGVPVQTQFALPTTLETGEQVTGGWMPTDALQFDPNYFDWQHYLNNRPDVVQAFGYSPDAAWRHFNESGRYEPGTQLREGYALSADREYPTDEGVFGGMKDLANFAMLASGIAGGLPAIMGGAGSAATAGSTNLLSNVGNSLVSTFTNPANYLKNAALQSIFNEKVDFGDMLKGMATGGITGGVANTLSNALTGASTPFGELPKGVASPVSQIAAGTLTGALQGQDFGDALKNSAIGTGIGYASNFAGNLVKDPLADLAKNVWGGAEGMLGSIFSDEVGPEQTFDPTWDPSVTGTENNWSDISTDIGVSPESEVFSGGGPSNDSEWMPKDTGLSDVIGQVVSGVVGAGLSNALQDKPDMFPQINQQQPKQQQLPAQPKQQDFSLGNDFNFMTQGQANLQMPWLAGIFDQEKSSGLPQQDDQMAERQGFYIS